MEALTGLEALLVRGTLGDGVATTVWLGARKGEETGAAPGPTEFYDPFPLGFLQHQNSPEGSLGFRPPSSPCPRSPHFLPTETTTTTASAPRHTQRRRPPEVSPRILSCSFWTTCHEQRSFGSGFNCTPSRCWSERQTVLNELGLVERPSGDVLVPSGQLQARLFLLMYVIIRSLGIRYKEHVPASRYLASFALIRNPRSLLDRCHQRALCDVW
jgi:hypothetical protein